MDIDHRPNRENRPLLGTHFRDNRLHLRHRNPGRRGNGFLNKRLLERERRSLIRGKLQR